MGASPEVRDFFGRTSVDVAKRHNRTKILELNLLEKHRKIFRNRLHKKMKRAFKKLRF